jgi:hypothetical protein
LQPSCLADGPSQVVWDLSWTGFRRVFGGFPQVFGRFSAMDRSSRLVSRELAVSYVSPDFSTEAARHRGGRPDDVFCACRETRRGGSPRATFGLTVRRRMAVLAPAEADRRTRPPRGGPRTCAHCPCPRRRRDRLLFVARRPSGNLRRRWGASSSSPYAERPPRA